MYTFFVSSDCICDIFRYQIIGFYDGISGISFGFAEQTHECDIDSKFAEAFGNVSNNARCIFLDNDDRAVFSGKINLHTIDPAQAGFSATERFSADRHLLPFFIYHQDIDGIRVYVGFYVVRNERIFDSVVCRDLARNRGCARHRWQTP